MEPREKCSSKLHIKTSSKNMYFSLFQFIIIRVLFTLTLRKWSRHRGISQALLGQNIFSSDCKTGRSVIRAPHYVQHCPAHPPHVYGLCWISHQNTFEKISDILFFPTWMTLFSLTVICFKKLVWVKVM